MDKLSLILSGIFNGLSVISGLATVYGGWSGYKYIFAVVLTIGISFSVIFVLLKITKSYDTHIKEKLDYIERPNVNCDNSIMENYQNIVDSINRLDESVNDLNIEIIKNHIEEIEHGLLNKLNESSNFKFRTSETTRELEIFIEKKENKNIKKVRIICFGRNGYGQTIDYIADNHPNIEIEMIVCNPTKNSVVCKPTDIDDIQRYIISASKAQKSRILVSDVPPSIRAAIVYSEDKKTKKLIAVWGIVEPYKFAQYNNGVILKRSDSSEEALIAKCDSKITNANDFNGIINYIEREFAYLEKHSHEPEIKSDTVVF